MRHRVGMAPGGLDVTQPFARSTAVAAGITDRALSGMGYRKIFSGVYVASHVPDTLVVRARAALLAVPAGGLVSHHTAARLWGGTVPGSSHIHVAYERDVGSAHDGIKIHRHRHRLQPARRHGVPVTSPEQTFAHLARHLDLVALVALGDALVRRQVTTPDMLAAYTRFWEGQCRRMAVGAAARVRARVDSAMETRVRLLMVLAGLPEPEIDHRLYVEDRLRFRIELAFAEVRLAIEYDGRWHEDPRQRVLDDTRRAELEAEGWRFVVLVAEDIFVTPETTLRRLASELAARGIPVPAVLSDDWRRFFPVRDVVS